MLVQLPQFEDSDGDGDGANFLYLSSGLAERYEQPEPSAIAESKVFTA